MAVLSAQKQADMYLWEHKNRPKFHWDKQRINKVLVDVRHQQGMLLGMAEMLGFDVKSPVVLDAMTADATNAPKFMNKCKYDRTQGSIAFVIGPASTRFLIKKDRSCILYRPCHCDGQDPESDCCVVFIKEQ
jgi:hypothetical protein